MHTILQWIYQITCIMISVETNIDDELTLRAFIACPFKHHNRHACAANHIYNALIGWFR